ncbi:Retrovirus-related Pol polyprotein from transposon 17.6 [Gossypium australe]|uniref:Retrovirus-related Pol polyprotein from transposon 17.6 n=1 Tax=Gossypium australe TaxID=47621 RepID=A0A5B6WG02_9ROSI|nr:Retrovirus-related Pol polyprotein from transposon 17.6 [Gossypium australe]
MLSLVNASSGCLSYYRRFVEGFSLIASLITKLLRKNASFKWFEEHQSSFEKLKSVLTQAPILVQPESGKDFVVYSDALHFDLGCVLMQDDYDYTIEYHPGKANVVADALSIQRLQQVVSSEASEFDLNSDRVLCFRSQSLYSMHPGGNKMYRDLRVLYWWSGLKREVTTFVSLCLMCQKVKVKHQLSLELLQPVKIPQWKGSWKDHLPLAEFAYKNSSQSSIQMEPNEALYGRKCRTLRVGLNIEYSVGDQVFLKVSSWQKVLRFGRKGKLSSRSIEPYCILKWVGPVSYQLEKPPKLDRIHDMFHVSMLRRYRSGPFYIVFVEVIDVKSDLTFEEEPVQILERDVKVLQRKIVPLVKVLWLNHGTEEAT